MTDCIHALGGKVLYHSCGMIRPFVADLIDLGVDIPAPTTARRFARHQTPWTCV